MNRYLIDRNIEFQGGLSLKYENIDLTGNNFNEFIDQIEQSKNRPLTEEEKDSLDNIISDLINPNLSAFLKIKDHKGISDIEKKNYADIMCSKYGSGYFIYQEKELNESELNSITFKNPINQTIVDFLKNNPDVVYQPILFLNDDRSYDIIYTAEQIKFWQENNKTGIVGVFRKINNNFNLLEILQISY